MRIGLDYLRTTPLLKELMIDDSELLIKSFQRGIKENCHKISHIPNIKLDWKYAQRDGEPQFDPDSHFEVTFLPFFFFYFKVFSHLNEQNDYFPNVFSKRIQSLFLHA